MLKYNYITNKFYDAKDLDRPVNVRKRVHSFKLKMVGYTYVCVVEYAVYGKIEVEEKTFTSHHDAYEYMDKLTMRQRMQKKNMADNLNFYKGFNNQEKPKKSDERVELEQKIEALLKAQEEYLKSRN